MTRRWRRRFGLFKHYQYFVHVLRNGIWIDVLFSFHLRKWHFQSIDFLMSIAELISSWDEKEKVTKEALINRLDWLQVSIYVIISDNKNYSYFFLLPSSMPKKWWNCTILTCVAYIVKWSQISDKCHIGAFWNTNLSKCWAVVASVFNCKVSKFTFF